MSAVRISTLDATVLEEGRARRAAVLERIRGAAERAGRDPAEVTLVGVAKKQPTPRILSAIAAGVHVLGQSYIQEAREIRPEIESALAGDPAAEGIRLEWRMVGRLQRNKAGLAARLFDAIESVDRVALVDTLARRVENEGRVLDVLLQVSLCGEPQKGGCEADELPALIDRVEACESLRLRGLMTVPAASADPEEARPVFRRLRELRDRLATERPDATLDTLSMGMSADLEVAVEEGATLVRVGTALFGERAQA
ncbi:MAG: YggS family pyridoxal phosphate-dependent enzyme [bacterium]|nr:YggS family pyridoxal phosphate-dependent enzyme [bacterium]